MPDVLVNGNARRVPDETTVAQLVLLVAGLSRGIAVAVNGEVLTRSAWPATVLSAGDEVEVLTAAQGG
ncbi:sulfur carrier protein ThiS [Pilimelia columellifera]|uniref:Thiamine biosynthesis protein ThiS n=1 Tax=Pilimelia columellifera subsp. columellifera TaxID=706583 RepID=A0ABP6APN5_9ACTN